MCIPAVPLPRRGLHLCCVVPQVSLLTSALVSALGPSTPLIIKVGAFDCRQQLEGVLTAAATAGVRAVAGINGLSRWVVTASGCLNGA